MRSGDYPAFYPLILIGDNATALISLMFLRRIQIGCGEVKQGFISLHNHGFEGLPAPFDNIYPAIGILPLHAVDKHFGILRLFLRHLAGFIPRQRKRNEIVSIREFEFCYHVDSTFLGEPHDLAAVRQPCHEESP